MGNGCFGVRCAIVSMVGACAMSAGATGGIHVDPGVDDYDFEWLTIGDPGNRWARPSETPLVPDRRIGKVNYRYRISKNETSDAQYFEFVLAYAPYVPMSDWGGSRFKSGAVLVGVANGVPQYSLSAHESITQATMSWRYAARYCNWLENGKVNEEWAFESGVYDTSTFSNNPNGTINDQPFHTPGSHYWIPSMDEWTKAVHWDPEAGEDGTYWRQPYGSHEQAVSGCPHVPGAETNAGLTDDEYQMCTESDEIGRYPDAQTPWGLLDASGGDREWLEGFREGIATSRQTRGSNIGMGEYYYRLDAIEHVGASSESFGLETIRLASVVPSPQSGAVMVMAMMWGARRKR